MLGKDHCRASGQVLAAFHAPVDAENRSRQSDHEARPAGDDAIARHGRKRERGERQKGVGRSDEQQRQREESRAQRRHGAKCSANAARSGNTCVAAGRFPSSRVFRPLPVSTSTGRAPAAAAAYTYLRASPTMYTSFSDTLKRRATSRSMPGWGLRHSQPASAACGQKKNASILPPICASARCTAS